MPTMSQHFIQKSKQATHFDWDTNAYPDPSEAEHLLQWFRENTTQLTNIPTSFNTLLNQISTAEFTDGSNVSIELGLLTDRIQLTDGTAAQPIADPDRAFIQRTSRAAYTYFNLISHALRPNPQD